MSLKILTSNDFTKLWTTKRNFSPRAVKEILEYKSFVKVFFRILAIKTL